MLKKWFGEYIQINKSEIVAVLIYLIIGILIGLGIYAFLSGDIKEMLVAEAKEVFDISKSSSYVKTDVLKNGIKANVLLVVIMAMFAVMLFGRLGIYLIVLLKGMALGIYTILLFNIFGPLWGIVTMLLLVILVNVLYLPAFIYLVISFLGINFNIFKTGVRSLNLVEMYRLLVPTIISFSIIFSSIVVEQIASGIVLNIYTKL